MRIPIDPDLPLPLYRQIENHFKANILAGTLPEETRLPAARQLAQALGVSRITVENAYAELEAAGFVMRRASSGTFVSPPQVRYDSFAPPEDWPLWQHQGNEWTGKDALSPPLTPHLQDGLIAFTGFGDPQQFRADEFYRAVKGVMKRDGAAALELGDTEGYAPLRTTVSDILSHQGIRVRPENVLITTGSQQALALVARLLLRSGDTVLTEDPTYDRALDLFRFEGVRAVGCPVDAAGMKVDELEPLLQQHHPKLIYTVPNFQNPTGTSLSLVRRQKLVALAQRYNVPVLEDDFAGELRFDGRGQPALKALDQNGGVIYLGTFSKLLMPGLRVGFLVAQGPVFEALIRRKLAHDFVTSGLMQRALEAYVTVGRYQAHVRRAVLAYRKRRDVMLAAIARHLPEAKVVRPSGGIFMWVELPVGVDADGLLPIAITEGVSYAPGSRFFVNPSEGKNYIRLNFAVQPPDAIERGVLRLKCVIRKMRRDKRSY